MVKIVCPNCGREFDSNSTAAMPFCSQRCQKLDLAQWLDEKHGLPYMDEDKADEPVGDDDY